MNAEEKEERDKSVDEVAEEVAREADEDMALAAEEVIQRDEDSKKEVEKDGMNVIAELKTVDEEGKVEVKELDKAGEARLDKYGSELEASRGEKIVGDEIKEEEDQDDKELVRESKALVTTLEGRSTHGEDVSVAEEGINSAER